MDKITLRKGSIVWEATFEGDSAARVKRLFGTTTLPTPFGTTIRPSVVLADVQKRNPDSTVTIAGTPE